MMWLRLISSLVTWVMRLFGELKTTLQLNVDLSTLPVEYFSMTSAEEDRWYTDVLLCAHFMC